MQEHHENATPSAAARRKRASNSKAGPSEESGESPTSLVPLFDLHGSPGHLLRRCHSRARAIFDELIGRETGLSKQQVALMVAVAQNPAAAHAQLSEATGFDRNTLAETVDRLIAKGLAVRERSKRDARAYEIGLTEAGHELLENLIPLSLEVQAKILDPLPEASRQMFIECLQILAGVPGPEGDPAFAAPRSRKQKPNR